MTQYCRNCGREINSKWKSLYYKYYHQLKSNYKSNKLQKRYGGKK